MAFVIGAAPRSLQQLGVGIVCVRWLVSFLNKGVSLRRQMGSRLIQSVGENNSGFGSNKDLKREAPGLFSSLVGVGWF